MDVSRRHQSRKRLRLRAVEILGALLEQQRKRNRRYHQWQHTVAQHRIDDDELEQQSQDHHRNCDADQRCEPEGSTEVHGGQNKERRQHDELALGEIDCLRGLPQEREADRNQGVDCAGSESRNQKLY